MGREKNAQKIEANKQASKEAGNSKISRNIKKEQIVAAQCKI